MTRVRAIVPIVAAALAGCLDATIGDSPVGPDATGTAGGSGDDVRPASDASAPDASPDAGGDFGGGGAGGGGDTPDAGAAADAGAAPDAAIAIDAGAGVDAAPEPGLEPFAITHSDDPDTVLELNSVACRNADTGEFFVNRYFRVFDLSDPGFDLGETVAVDEITAGIEVAVAQVIGLNLYRLDGELASDNLEPVASFSPEIPEIPEPAIARISFDVPREFQREDVLVVEIAAADRFFIGSNQAGESDPSFIQASDCGIAEPVPFAQVAEQPIHVVMEVLGETGDASAAAPSAAPGDATRVDVAPLR